MRYLLLALLAVGLAGPLATPAWATSGWYRGPSATTQPVTRVRPRQIVYWISDEDTTVPHWSATLNTEDCTMVSTEWCLQPGEADENAGVLARIFLYGVSDAAGTAATRTPYDADINGGSVDHVGLTGDCGDDGEDNGTELNDSKFYGWSLTRPYFQINQTVALEAGKRIVFSLMCHE